MLSIYFSLYIYIMSVCNDNKPVTKCHGQSDVYRDLRQNNRPQRMISSSFLDEKKAFNKPDSIILAINNQNTNFFDLK